MITSACAQMGHFYDLTVGSAAGMCDAKMPDMQAGYEKGLTAGISAMTGINLMYDGRGIGILELFSPCGGRRSRNGATLLRH